MAPLFALLAASNVATSFLAVSVLKDTYAKEGAKRRSDIAPMTPKRLLDHKNHNGKPLLAGRSGNPLASGSTVASLTLSDLPLLGQDFDYNSIKSVTLPPVDGVARGYTVQGFAWYNSTDLDLYLSLDRTLHIVGSMIFVSRTSETGDADPIRRRRPHLRRLRGRLGSHRLLRRDGPRRDPRPANGQTASEGAASEGAPVPGASSRGQYCQSPAFEKRYLLRPPRRDREGAEGGDA